MSRTASMMYLSWLLLGASLLGPTDAAANGNYSHLWAALDGLNYLPPGELRDLLTQPELKQMLQNGANFPDGGYAVGDGYGEISHWEPLHLAYLEWIRATYQPPWSAEATQHIAFLMGMVAHGMSDQLYDGMFLERHKYYDPFIGDVPMLGLDGATDSCFAAIQGPIEVPKTWVPADVMAPFYLETDGHTVLPKTIETGQKLVAAAIMISNDAVTHPDKVVEYTTMYPYACQQQNNIEIPGTIPTHGAVIARFWAVMWDRLHGKEAWDQPLLGTFFTTSQPWAQTLDSANPDSWVSFAMPFGLDPSTVNNTTVVVKDSQGNLHPVQVKVYYGWNSHLVNLMPQQDWAADTDYTVTVSGEIKSWDGHLLTTTHTFDFSTKPAPEQPEIIENTPIESDDLGGGGDLDQDAQGQSDLSPLEDLSGADVGSDLSPDAGQDAVVPDVPAKKNSGGCSASLPGGGMGNLLLLALLLAGLALVRRTRQGAGKDA